MKNIKSYLILLPIILCFGCDPAFEHAFKGKVVNTANGQPLQDVKVAYTFYPIENRNHWRAQDVAGDSITFTDENGDFKINFSTLTITFDSISIQVNKEGYQEKVVVSAREEWKSRLGFNHRTFRFNFGKIKLEKEVD